MSESDALACPPVVLVCYNRAPLVRRLIGALREAAPAQVFVIADGPRTDDPGDAVRCAEVRAALAEEIDWSCRVERRYAEHNQGVEQTIELGLDWVFGQVDRAIVLEDDCIPHPTFFRYAAELLERYADDEQVMQVSGTHFAIPPEVFGTHSYVLTTFSITWGWATWSRAWHRHRASFPRDYRTAPDVRHGADSAWRRGDEHYAPGALVTAAGRRYFNEVGRARGHEFGWDSQWFRSHAIFGALAINPAVNMVLNAGFGEEATHTVSTRTMPAAQPAPFPLAHPPYERNIAAQRCMERGMVHTNGRLARTVRRLLPHAGARTWARRFARRLLGSP